MASLCRPAALPGRPRIARLGHPARRRLAAASCHRLLRAGHHPRRGDHRAARCPTLTVAPTFSADCPYSSNSQVSGPSSEEPKTTPFVKEQQCRAALLVLVRSRRVPDRSSGTWTRAKAVPWRPAFRAKQGAGRSGGTSDARRKQDQASPVNARGGNVPRHDRSAASYGSPGDNTRSTGWGPVNVRAGPRLRREWPRCWRRRSPLGRGSARW